MKASVIHAYGAPEELKFEDQPDPILGRSEVLVRVSATSVNPIDLKIRSGAAKDRFPVTFPAILGVDVSGVVEALGADASGFAVGERVFAHASRTYASLCAVKASGLARIPEGLEIIEAAALPTVTTTGAQLAELAIRGQRSGTVLVTGALGSVGRSAVFTARERGWTVVAGVRKKQLEEAEALGADRVVALDDESIQSLPSLDAVANTIAGPTADRLLAKIKEGGTFASVVGPPNDAASYPRVKIEAMQVKAVPTTLVHMAEAVMAGKLKIPLGQRFALADAGAAHAAAEAGAVGKLLLLP